MKNYILISYATMLLLIHITNEIRHDSLSKTDAILITLAPITFPTILIVTAFTLMPNSNIIKS